MTAACSGPAVAPPASPSRAVLASPSRTHVSSPALPFATHSVDPGTLPQTHALPSSTTKAFRTRMQGLWEGIVRDAPVAAMQAFFPEAAYVRVKSVADPAADFRERLVTAFRRDVHAAHVLLGAGAPEATFLRVVVPHQWAWIPPGACANSIGYWHAPGSRLMYREGGAVRSFGVFSLISWRGEWYVVHLSSYDAPGTVDAPATGRGTFGPPGGC